jgi:hypothetical protein
MSIRVDRSREHVLLGLFRLDAASTRLIRAQEIDPQRRRSEVERGLGDSVNAEPEPPRLQWSDRSR